MSKGLAWIRGLGTARIAAGVVAYFESGANLLRTTVADAEGISGLRKEESCFA